MLVLVVGVLWNAYFFTHGAPWKERRTLSPAERATRKLIVEGLPDVDPVQVLTNAAPAPAPFRAPEPGMYVSSWFGEHNTRARVIATDPVHGLIVFTISRAASDPGSGQFPTFAEVKRLYHADEGQDVGTLAKAAFEWRNGHLYVSDFALAYPPRFVDPRVPVEAHAWESITRFRLEQDGSLIAVDFDPTFASTIARRYVRLEKP